MAYSQYMVSKKDSVESEMKSSNVGPIVVYAASREKTWCHFF